MPSPDETCAASVAQLRRGCLAVSVLQDVDLQPGSTGITLTGSPQVFVSWAECRRAVGDDDPEAAAGRTRLSAWLLARRWAATLSPDELEASLQPVGLPLDHVLHQGPGWNRERVLGDALDLGWGARGLDPADPEGVVLLPPTALEGTGVDELAAWDRARAGLEDLGRLAAARVRLDAKGQLRPFGPCDVVTLLGAASLRSSLAEQAGGLGAAVVPMRRRGWTRLALIDPAFAPAAAAATPAEQRGFTRPLLVTADELTLVPVGGRPEIVLRDPVAQPPWERDVLYR